MLLLCSVLSACAVGPDYRPPQTPPSAQGAFASTAAASSVTAPAPPDWWRLYDDATLDGLVQDALTQNADLKVAAANLLRALGVLQEARAGRFPATALTANDAWGKSSTAGLLASLQGAEARPRWSFGSAFGVSYEVDLFGRVRRTIEAARADAAATAEAEDAVRVAVVAETARAYADACAWREQADVAARSADTARQILDLTARQRDLGARSDFDVASAAAVHDQALAAVPTFEGQWRASLFALAVLTGRPPAEISAAAAACRTPPTIRQPLPVGDGAALLKRRPDVRLADRVLAADTARIGVQVAGLYPTVTLNGDIAAAGSTLAKAFSSGGLSYQLGPLISWTFPNVLVARARIAQARAQASGDIAEFDSVVLTALREAEQALSAYDAELKRHAALAATRADTQRAFDLAQVQLQHGAIAFTDLLITERNLDAASAELATSDQALVDDQVAVFQALGGGWENAPPVIPPKAP
jgi:NodT family efflux transporter outer membrane factor (OMF) lipoprotein